MCSEVLVCVGRNLDNEIFVGSRAGRHPEKSPAWPWPLTLLAVGQWRARRGAFSGPASLWSFSWGEPLFAVTLCSGPSGVLCFGLQDSGF